jgi:uncharacterized protein YbjT (DUF2867 family)
MILVAGGTGLVGSEVCQRLVRRGEAVRALVRSTSSREKIEALRSSGIELCVGDLKDPQSIVAACRGVNAVISTASSTLTRHPGDSIQSVDATGQLNLVNAAKEANVARFVFVSFRRTPGISFPLGDAKAQVEDALSSLNFTVIQASWFMEVWLSPAWDSITRTRRPASTDREQAPSVGCLSAMSLRSARSLFGIQRPAGSGLSSADRKRSAPLKW